MSRLSEVIEQNGRGLLPRENMGLPSLDLCDMQGIEIPLEYEITGVLGDILMCEISDENESGEVLRNGIWLKQDIVGKMWRVAKIIKKGNRASKELNVGDYVMYPSDRGIPAINMENKKLIFLNEERIFCICKPKQI